MFQACVLCVFITATHGTTMPQSCRGSPLIAPLANHHASCLQQLSCTSLTCCWSSMHMCFGGLLQPSLQGVHRWLIVQPKHHEVHGKCRKPHTHIACKLACRCFELHVHGSDTMRHVCALGAGCVPLCCGSQVQLTVTRHPGTWWQAPCMCTVRVELSRAVCPRTVAQRQGSNTAMHSLVGCAADTAGKHDFCVARDRQQLQKRVSAVAMQMA